MITPVERQILKDVAGCKVNRMIPLNDDGKAPVRKKTMSPDQSRILHALNTIDPNLTGAGNSNVEHFKTTQMIRACYCVASELMRPEEPVIIICWTAAEIFVTGFPSPVEPVIPFVLSHYLPLKYVLWAARNGQFTVEDPRQVRSPNIKDFAKIANDELFWKDEDIISAYMTLTAKQEDLRQGLLAKVEDSEFRSQMMYEMFQITNNYHYRNQCVFDKAQ